MSKTLPSLKQLEYLVALKDTEHFGDAAKRCHIAPSTLSVGIRELENLLGVTLAERDKRNVLMTAVGKEIAENARQVLRDAEDIVDLAAANQELMTGDMRLGVIPTISPFLLPRVLPKLNNQYPDLKLFLREERSDPVLSLLRKGEIDIALIALPFEIDGLDSQVLMQDNFKFACSEGHRLANRKKVSAADLAKESLMLLEEGHCLRGHALDACQLSLGPERAQFEASSLHTLVQMVAAGIGVTLLPQLAIDADVTKGSHIKLIPLSFPAARQIGLVWRQSSRRAQEFKMLGEVLSV